MGIHKPYLSASIVSSRLGYHVIIVVNKRKNLDAKTNMQKVFKFICFLQKLDRNKWLKHVHFCANEKDPTTYIYLKSLIKYIKYAIKC